MGSGNNSTDSRNNNLQNYGKHSNPTLVLESRPITIRSLSFRRSESLCNYFSLFGLLHGSHYRTQQSKQICSQINDKKTALCKFEQLLQSYSNRQNYKQIDQRFEGTRSIYNACFSLVFSLCLPDDWIVSYMCVYNHTFHHYSYGCYWLFGEHVEEVLSEDAEGGCQI